MEKIPYILFLLIFLIILFIIFLLNLLVIIIDKGNKLEKDLVNFINKYGKIFIDNINNITFNLKKKSNEQVNYILTYVAFLVILLIIIAFIVITNIDIIKINFKKYKQEFILYILLLLIFALPFYLYNAYYTSKFFLEI